jgi:cell division protein FtsB
MDNSRYRLSHKKELYYILCIVALLAILLFSFLGPGGYRELRKQRIQLQEQRMRIDKLKQNNYERMKTIEDLRSNKEALERFAREKGYGREDEIILQLPKEPEKKPQQSAPAKK